MVLICSLPFYLNPSSWKPTVYSIFYYNLLTKSYTKSRGFLLFLSFILIGGGRVRVGGCGWVGRCWKQG
jgi:hypothetical protein